MSEKLTKKPVAAAFSRSSTSRRALVLPSNEDLEVSGMSLSFASVCLVSIPWPIMASVVSIFHMLKLSLNGITELMNRVLEQIALPKSMQKSKVLVRENYCYYFFFFVKMIFLRIIIFNLSLGTVFNLFAIGVLMPIMTQVLKLSDLTITAFCVFSSFTGITTILLAGLAGHYKYLYLANAFRMFSDVTTVGIRSALSKLVGSSDVGKVSYYNVEFDRVT